jgi:hypothetical protein
MGEPLIDTDDTTHLLLIFVIVLSLQLKFALEQAMKFQ